MPNQPKTPVRSHRIPDEEYLPARDKAAREGETMTDVIRRALRRYVVGALLGALVLVSIGGTSQASAPAPAPAVAAPVNWGWNCMTMGTKVCDSSYRTVDWGMADTLSGIPDHGVVGLPNRFRHWEDCKVSSNDWATAVVCPDGFFIDRDERLSAFGTT